MGEINKLPSIEQLEVIDNEKLVNEKLDAFLENIETTVEKKEALAILNNIDKYTSSDIDLVYDKVNKLYTLVNQKELKTISSPLNINELDEIYNIILPKLKENDTNTSNLYPKDIEEASVKINEEAKKILEKLTKRDIKAGNNGEPITEIRY